MRVPFRAGTVIADTFSVYFANLVPFALITLVVYSPMLVALVLFSYSEEDSMQAVSGIALLFLGAFLAPAASGAVTYGVFQHVRGQKASVGDCLAIGFHRLLPVIGVSFVTGLVTGIGILLCIVPGLIAMTMYATAIPTAVIEKRGVMDSMGRSTQLTKGTRWPVFGVIFVLALIQNIASWIVTAATTASGSQVAVVAGSGITTIVLGGLAACSPALIYYHLRRAKESIDIEEIASVFD